MALEFFTNANQKKEAINAKLSLLSSFSVWFVDLIFFSFSYLMSDFIKNYLKIPNRKHHPYQNHNQSLV